MDLRDQRRRRSHSGKPISPHRPSPSSKRSSSGSHAIARELTGMRRACLAGGVALNCAANRRLREDGPFDDVWVQPASSDAGGALGAALWTTHELGGEERPTPAGDGMGGARLGPSFDDREVSNWLRSQRVPFETYESSQRLVEAISERIAQGSIVGWFQGRMEFGPRALGCRSILADPPRTRPWSAESTRRSRVREGFRPLAPAVVAEKASSWFVVDRPSPYMLFTAAVVGATPESDAERSAPFADRLAVRRSAIPACTHVDGSARVQTVSTTSSSTTCSSRSDVGPVCRSF